MMDDSALQLLTIRTILSFFQPFCGAMILLLFYRWLRGKQVNDNSLLWLSACLLGLTPGAFVQYAGWGGQHQYLLPFFFSPLSNSLSVLTAFQLLRVREAIIRRGYLQWSRFLTAAIIVTSLVVEALLLLVWAGALGKSVADAAILIDAVSSCVALFTLGLCMSYSFMKYGNQPLILLTLGDFAYIVGYQIYLVTNHGKAPTLPFAIAADITSVSFLTMLFIALALAWGLSSASRLKFREHEHVNIVAVSIDVRGSTAFAARLSDKGVGEFVVSFMNKFCERVTGMVSEALDVTPTVKFMGDGVVLVWEVPDSMKLVDYFNAVVGLCCALYGGHSTWLASHPDWGDDVPKHIGIGIDFGAASRLTSESGSYDYLGLPLSYAAKMQGLARPKGGVVIRAKWSLPDYLRNKFKKSGLMVIGDECIQVRATSRVEFKQAELSRREVDDLGLV